MSSPAWDFSPDLPTCASNCLSTALESSSCTTTDPTCTCSTPVVTSAIACYNMQCMPKPALSSTNMTRSACGVPEDDESDLTPALAGALGMLALIMVGLRVVQRVWIKKSFGWDDGLILMGFACAIPLNVLAFPLQKYGLGTNIWTISLDDIPIQLKLLLLAEIFYMPAEAFTQLSFLAFYQRIFPPSKYLAIAYGLAAITICFGVSNTLVMIFQCTPVDYFWTSWTGETSGTCIDINRYSWYRAGFQIVMDLSIIALPLWPLSTLKLGRQKKVWIMVMFCTGFLITIVSCLRLRSLVMFAQSANPSMDNNPAIYWSIVECDVAIICACMPCLPALVQPFCPDCFGSSKGSEKSETPAPVRLRRMKPVDWSIMQGSQDELVTMH